MVAHGEPSHEYSNEQKAQYREAVWVTFAGALPDPATAKVLFFPSKHGFEIPVALRHGFQEANLIACDENAAVLATAKWRKDYPAVRCYGTSLSRTITRLVQDNVRLDAANLDFCSNLCHSVMADIHALLSTQENKNGLNLGVTLMKGREDKTVADIARLVFCENTGAVDRVGVVQSWLAHWGYGSRLLLRGEYRSGTKNMVFAAFKTLSEKMAREQTHAFFEAHLGEIEALLELDEKVLAASSRDEYERLQTEFHEGRGELHDALWEYLRAQGLWFGLPQVYAAMGNPALWKWHCLMEIGTRRYRGPEPSLAEVQQQLRKARQQLTRATSENAQLLQAGRAYR